MKFAIAKQVITPKVPVFLAGYGNRDRKSDGVLDDIFLKVALLEGSKRIVIITIDALGGDRSFVTGIKQALWAQFGLSSEQILINFSHTHCSIFLTGDDEKGRRGGYSLGQDEWPEREEDIDYRADIAYYQYIRESTVQLVNQCIEQAVEGKVLINKGTSHAGVSRRLLTEEGLLFRPNFQAETDQDLFVLQFVNLQNQVKGILFSYACHPNCIGKNQISADFVGVACADLEAQFPNCTAMFLQGCAADIKPLKCVDVDHFKACTLDEMKEAGIELAQDVIAAMGNSESQQLEGNIQTAEVQVRLFTEPWGIFQMQAIADDETKTDYKRRAARRAVQAMVQGKVKQVLPYTIMLWQLESGFRIAALEGEVPSEIALEIKHMFSQINVMVLGYANGVPTYITTSRILKEGGYEADAFVLHGYRGPFVPENDWILLGAMKTAESYLK